MIRMSGITEERWQENPHELGLMALFYVAGFVALKYERRLDLDFNFLFNLVFMPYKYPCVWAATSHYHIL